MSDFMKELKQYRHLLPKQTLKSIKGQALSGDIDGARKGLNRVLEKTQSNKDKMVNAHRNTRYIKRQYSDIDYRGQFAISLKEQSMPK